MKSTMGLKQRGSAIFNMIILLLAAYGIYLGIQYVPQLIESRTVDSMLYSIEAANLSDPAQSVQAVESMIDKQLQVNEMGGLRSSFDVERTDRAYVIRVSYERSLNLGFDVKTIQFEKSMTLKR